MHLNSSLFSLDDTQHTKVHDSTYNNFGLKMGIVLEAMSVDDAKNISKTSMEYNVFVFEANGRESSATVLYKNCIAMESFGGLSDFFEYSLRKTPKKEIPSPKDAVGSMVLLMTLNGQTSNGVIVGALHNPNKKSKLTKENGHMLEAEFNGINWNINKDGEFTIAFRTATDINGKAKDDKIGGTFIKIDKTGSIIFSDNNKESITIDKTKKTIAVVAESDILLNSQAKVILTSKDNTQISCKDLIASAEGRASFNVKGELNMKIDGPANIKGASVKIESDGSVDVKGSNIKLSGQSIQLGDSPSPALTLQTIYIGVGNMGAPVISSSCGPYSSVVSIS